MGARWGRLTREPPRVCIRYPAPCIVCVVVPWCRRGAYMVSVENRPNIRVGAHPQVFAVICRDASQLLDSVASVARRLANGPGWPLRVVLDDSLDPGLSTRCALLFLAAVHRAGADDGARLAA